MTYNLKIVHPKVELRVDSTKVIEFDQEFHYSNVSSLSRLRSILLNDIVQYNNDHISIKFDEIVKSIHIPNVSVKHSNHIDNVSKTIDLSDYLYSRSKVRYSIYNTLCSEGVDITFFNEGNIVKTENVKFGSLNEENSFDDYLYPIVDSSIFSDNKAINYGGNIHNALWRIAYSPSEELYNRDSSIGLSPEICSSLLYRELVSSNSRYINRKLVTTDSGDWVLNHLSKVKVDQEYNLVEKVARGLLLDSYEVKSPLVDYLVNNGYIDKDFKSDVWVTNITKWDGNGSLSTKAGNWLKANCELILKSTTNDLLHKAMVPFMPLHRLSIYLADEDGMIRRCAKARVDELL